MEELVAIAATVSIFALAALAFGTMSGHDMGSEKEICDE
jgi:hypothetical protein